MDLFLNEYVDIAISRIQKFAKIAAAMDLQPALGFSGGKDSIVCYELCKRAGIDFSAYFNRAFESAVTVKFIHDNFPDVIERKLINCGFFGNIKKNHNGMLPTAQIAYCCKDFKHNSKLIDKCSIVGVRAAESNKRRTRKALSFKNERVRKKIDYKEYFTENCVASGAPNLLQLSPIIDWSTEMVWDFINNNNLPINPEYEHGYERIGCMICPKSNFARNVKRLYEFPKLVKSLIKIRKEGNCDWIITSDNKDYKDDKIYYICRYLNYSFAPFSKKQQKLYEDFREWFDKQNIIINP